MDFINGGVAGAFASIFTNPMDVVKIRMQLQGEMSSKNAQITHYRNFMHAVYVIAKTDGLMALQRGLVPALIVGFTMNSVRLGIYHIAERKQWTKNDHGGVDTASSALWSGIGGAVGGISGNPATIVKTRMQATAHPSIAVGRQHKYSGTIQAFCQIYKMEGLKGFFAGVNATCIRMFLGSAVQLTTFSATKEALLKRGIMSEKSPVLLAFIASSICGVASAVTMSPLDVVTTRLYNQGAGGPGGGGLKYKGFLDCLVKTFKAEGLVGLYKGVGPFYFRIAPHTTASLVIWDTLNDIQGQRTEK